MRQTWALPALPGTSWLPGVSDAETTGFDLDDLTLALLVGSLVLVVSVVAVRLSLRSGCRRCSSTSASDSSSGSRGSASATTPRS